MSQARSPSQQYPYGLARVCRVWELSRATVYRQQQRRLSPRSETKTRRGPRGPVADGDLLAKIREVIQSSPWLGEGHRKIWARLRWQGLRSSKRRVLRLMREAGLLAPVRAGRPHGPKAHDGSIIPEAPDQMWGTDTSSTLTGEGNATIFFVIDHCTAECLGIHAARYGSRYEALEPIHQAVHEVFGDYHEGVALGKELRLRHDHGSQFVSAVFQDELHFLSIDSSPSFIKEPEGNGCAERFVRTLKEQLLWLVAFDTVAELNQALQDFKQRYNHQWLIQRHGHCSPAEQRRRLLAGLRKVA